MKTNTIKVNNKGNGTRDVINEVIKYCNYMELDKKSSLHLQLLGEETVSLINSVAGDFEGKFWIEDDGKLAKLHLEANVMTDLDQRDQLLSVSKNGENIFSKGLLGKIRDMIDICMVNDSYPNSMYNMMSYGIGSSYSNMTSDMIMTDMIWSLKVYSENIELQEEEKEQWDELEKSILANLADDVKIGVKSNKVVLEIEKKIA